MDWSFLLVINAFFVFFNGYIAISCFKDGNDFGGHLNMLAVVVNAMCVANKLV